MQSCFDLHGDHCKSLCEQQLELVHSRKNHGLLLCERRHLQKQNRDLAPSAGQSMLIFPVLLRSINDKRFFFLLFGA